MEKIMSQQQHTMESIMKLGNNWMASRVFLTGVELDLYSLLADKPLSIDEILAEKKADKRGMTILLDALSSLGLLVKNDDKYQTEKSASPLLTDNSPDSILPMALHMCTLWQSWSKLTDVVLGKPPAQMTEKGALARDHIEAFIGAMHMAALKTAPEVVSAVNPGTARRLIDVGGGSGSYTIAFLSAAPDMKATLFDLPDVIEMARERFKAAGMSDRVTLTAGDFYIDELPPGNDLALLSAIIHQNSLIQNDTLYRKIYGALDQGGRIVVRDHVMSRDRTQPMDGALFAVNMLAGTPRGGTYTFEEIKEGLSVAGFTRIRLIRTKGMFSLVEGFKQ
jgi:ubiquinone/menaquinone biosynthesis C-methylase UbiE